MQFQVGHRRAHVDHRPPLREARAEGVVVLEPFAEAVEALGDLLAGGEGEVLGAGIDLDAGDRAGRLDQVDERRAVLGLLADGLVIEDDAGDGGLHRLGAEQHLAVVAASLLGGLDAERVEALGDGAAALVGGKDALALRDHCLRDVFDSLGHGCVLPEVRSLMGASIALAAADFHRWRSQGRPGRRRGRPQGLRRSVRPAPPSTGGAFLFEPA